MEKKYCLHCQTLCSEENVCKVCGKQEFCSLIIKVQYQSEKDSKTNY
ncbi:hypothetical protein BAOM_3462 [Peribacillus asahii]|uniref:Uncharacterized protein n=1 Tax=Peribacillus asahii TaxID=228899 RepID=A0A3T0KV14_9BACI|nr:hypothetical protein [Peribacillus asahii]AZV44071.1 hypothetical protein BAOM_3462 [Peribacillus asahii]